MKQCLAHIERELKALETSPKPANQEFAKKIFPILHDARLAHRDFHADKLSLEELRQYRIIFEARLEEVLNHPPPKGWAADSQNLANRFRKHWTDWFTQFWILD